MKNIHILPTDKPTTLFKDDFGNFIYSINIDPEQNHFEPQHIYITSDEEIKDNDWVYCPVLKKPVFICLDSILMFKNLGYDSNGNSKYKKEWLKKIILTTDPDLIKDGVQAIDDEFLEWFVKNPSCEFADVNDWLDDNGNIFGDKRYQLCNHLYDNVIPKEEPEQETVGKQFYKTADMVISVVRNKETLEEASARLAKIHCDVRVNPNTTEFQIQQLIIKGAKWQAERMYSEEDLKRAFEAGHKKGFSGYPNTENWKELPFEKWFEQIKKK